MDFGDIKINFINPVSPHLKCYLCSEVFKKPLNLSCGHTFCEKCIEDYFNKIKSREKMCPKCLEKLTWEWSSRDIIAFKIINSLDISCPQAPYCSKDCKWRGN